MTKIAKQKFISIDPENPTLRDVHHLLLGGIGPRPIALVSTISADGINNLAPFSFYNAMGANPPYLAFSPAFGGRDGSAKDTYNNLKNIPECVVHSVTYDIIEQMNLTSASFSAEVDEFVISGFTPIDSDLVKPKRVQESPFHMECRVEQIIPLGGKNGSGNLVLCRVVKFHVNEVIYKDGSIDPQDIDLVGRNSGNYYTRSSGKAIFELKRPRGTAIGLDLLPRFVCESHILSANNLAQLANRHNLPEKEEITAFLDSYKKMALSAENIIELKDDDNYKNIFCAGVSLINTEFEKAIELMEVAAKRALDKHDADFAILALFSINFYAEQKSNFL